MTSEQAWLRFPNPAGLSGSSGPGGSSDPGGRSGANLRASHAPVLICLPHAGGSASAYSTLAARLRPAVEVCAVQYPGRLDRLDETPLSSIAELVDRLVEVTGPYLERLAASQCPYALFGHSMGAVVGYELALRLEAGPGPAPRRLFTSARRAPSRTRPDDIHSRPDDALFDHIIDLGGVPPEVAADPDVRAMALPALRADYTAIEQYRDEPPGRRVRCPITALIGDADPVVDGDEAAAWKEHTSGGFELEVFTGGHFYLAEHVSAVARIITDRLTGG